MHKRYVLILTVEGPKAQNNLNNKLYIKETRDYLKESVQCIKYWRKNAGLLKDIDIHINCPSEDIDPLYKEIYKDFNVVYHNVKFEKHILNDYGFVNVHHTGKYFSEILDYDYFIHIDVDMYILKPIPDDVLNLLQNYDCLVGGYDKENSKLQRDPIISNELINTDFIITSKSFGKIFYNDILENYSYIYDNLDNYKNCREYDIEEYAADLACKNLRENIYIFNDITYELGEGYIFYDNIIPIFWHEHLYKKPNETLLKQRIDIMKRIKND